MSIFNNLESFGTVETTRSYSYSKHLAPAERRRRNFVRNAKEQIKAVATNAPLAINSWVSTRVSDQGQESYKVGLRVGPRLIELPNGGTHLIVDTREKVVKFLEGVIEACEAGEMDDLLEKTSQSKKAVPH